MQNHIEAPSLAGPSRLGRCNTIGHSPVSAPAKTVARANTITAVPLSSNMSSLYGLGIQSTPSKRAQASRTYHHQRHVHSAKESDAPRSRAPWSPASASSSAATTPSLVSSRSDSLKSACSPRRHPREHCCITVGTDMPTLPPESGMEWSERARRWSSTMSRKVNIAALNQTLHSTTSPLLRAGIKELRSIFDVDTLGDDPFEETDVELASPKVSRQGPRFTRHYSDTCSGLVALPLIESPHMLSPDLSASRSAEEHADPRPASVQSAKSDAPCRPAYVAVWLAALGVSIIALCAFETMLHPDVASIPLATFMLAQPAFALLGIVSLALQTRWLMDLSSRLVRAHVLGQALIAVAAIRSLSQSAFYGQQSPALPLTAHTARVGSSSDQFSYVVVTLAQAALPLAAAFWAQYAVASSLSHVSRSTAAKPTPARKDRHESGTPNCISPPVSPVSDRRRPNSNSTGPWLGLTVTRLGTTQQFHLDADELTKRLERFASDARPLQRRDMYHAAPVAISA